MFFASIFHEEDIPVPSPNAPSNKVNVNIQVPSNKLNKVRMLADQLNKQDQQDQKRKLRNEERKLRNINSKSSSNVDIESGSDSTVKESYLRTYEGGII